MDYKEKVEYLYGYKRKMAQIASIIEEHERWMTIGTKVTQMFNADFCGGGGGSNRIERAGIELSKIDAELEQAIEERDVIVRVIRTRSKYPRYADLLEMRFIGGMSYNRIADVIDKDVRTVQRVMRKAIDTLEI